MVQVSYPGVYVEEVPSSVHTITAVATSITAFLGRASKGPLNKAIRCLSLSDFNRSFGAPHPQSELAAAVRLFFANGGTDCYVVRLAAADAAKAKLTLRDVTKARQVLVATAKTHGAWGNGVRLEVSYDTPNPDETFNLTVIYENGETEVSREQHSGLSMDPTSPRFAPEFVTQSSNLIDLALHANLAPGGSADLRNFANSFAGYSQSRAFKTNLLGQFRTDFEALLNGGPRFELNVDDTQYVPINLSTVLGAAAPAIALSSAWSLLAMSNRIAQVINDQLNAAVPGLQVTCNWRTSGDFSALRIISNGTAPIQPNQRKSVRVRRSTSQDFAVPMMLGLDQGGVEVARYSNYRPVPTAAYFRNPDDFVALAALTQNDITSIAIDGAPAVTFSFTDPWLPDSTGQANGVREKLRTIAKEVNNTANLPWKAEVWGYHLAFLAKDGSINKTPTSIVSAGNALLGGANFELNVRRYSLGNTGTGNYQEQGTAADVGDDGTAPGYNEYVGNPTDQTGLHALDSVDLFNLMVLPADVDVDATTQMQLWGPASNYCQQRRAFLIIDPPASWVANSRPAVAGDTQLINDLRQGGIVTDHAAVFFPRIRYKDAGLIKNVGPSGAIAGLMARTDATRGVWKAPAGVEADVREVLGLELKLTDLENGVLNKKGVNCLRIFPSGTVNWGARTLKGDDDFGSEWKYIPIRRLALNLAESLYRGTKWAVFEPNDEPLWARIRLNVGAFMMSLFRQGAFQGSNPKDAFFVKCDAETTTQDDRNKGTVNIEVGFAPLKPAEFVVIRIQQMAGQLQ